MSWERFGGAGNARKVRFGQVLGRNRSFLVAIEFLVLCRNRGSLCHDMVLKLEVVA